MDDDVKEISYLLLQNEYLKRKNIELSDDNMMNIIKTFPENWFSMYSVEDRIKLLSYALKNNQDIIYVINNIYDNSR